MTPLQDADAVDEGANECLHQFRAVCSIERGGQTKGGGRLGRDMDILYWIDIGIGKWAIENTYLHSHKLRRIGLLKQTLHHL